MPLLQKGIQACGQLAELAEDYISAHMSLGSVGAHGCAYISHTPKGLRGFCYSLRAL